MAATGAFSPVRVVGDAIALISARAEQGEEQLMLVAPEAVVRDVLVHALDAPVAASRLALDPGTIAEVEVRLDAPWTVNRINDACHLPERSLP